MKKIRIILGSRSDLPQLRETIRALREKYVGTVFSIIDVDVMSIHRNPIDAWTFVFTDNCKGADAIFYCGSKAFAAPGVLDAFAAAAISCVGFDADVSAKFTKRITVLNSPVVRASDFS